jgi:hypothetical protein
MRLWADRKRWAWQADSNRCIFRSRRLVGWCDTSARLFRSGVAGAPRRAGSPASPRRSSAAYRSRSHGVHIAGLWAACGGTALRPQHCAGSGPGCRGRSHAGPPRATDSALGRGYGGTPHPGAAYRPALVSAASACWRTTGRSAGPTLGGCRAPCSWSKSDLCGLCRPNQPSPNRRFRARS